MRIFPLINVYKIGISKLFARPALDAIEEGIRDYLATTPYLFEYNTQNANGGYQRSQPDSTDIQGFFSFLFCITDMQFLYRLKRRQLPCLVFCELCRHCD